VTRRPFTLLPAAGLLGLMLVAGAPIARAQTGSARKSDSKTQREGLVLGAAMGVSQISAGFADSGFGGSERTSVGGPSADLQFGGMLHRRVGLLVHLNLARGTEGATQSLHASALIGARMFVTPVFWFEIAVGTSGYQERDTIDDRTLEEHAHSFAWMLSGGIEFYQSERFTIDLRGGLTSASYNNEFSARVLQGLIGLNWY
jgi:hypothetical protein